MPETKVTQLKCDACGKAIVITNNKDAEKADSDGWAKTQIRKQISKTEYEESEFIGCPSCWGKYEKLVKKFWNIS